VPDFIVIGVKPMRLADLGCISIKAQSNIQGGSQGQRKQSPFTEAFPRLNIEEILGPEQEKNAEGYMKACPMY
jgi:hypothetical protein